MPTDHPACLALAAITALTSLPVHAAENGASSPGGLQARLLLTADEKALRHIWETSPTPPRLPVTDRARLGASASTVIIFKGCAPDPAGHCDVDVEFEVAGPDGKAQNAGSAKLWSAAPLGQKFMLGAASATLAFHGEEDLGSYTVRARLSDRVAQRQLELSAPLRVER
ncbi:hypothetical protein HNP48_003439 [Acidovorax soli]|uniref:Uncharacterized protein n=1 Tax=Acidovorax soli TaxID=592050 RepID=A0A7X0PF15_9BURK|nr:hypothetical protein [Acidovorax soli]MBB6560763.1 hypothetical protein [Acidovorax soli]